MADRNLGLVSILTAGLWMLAHAVAADGYNIAGNTTAIKRGITLTPAMNGINFPDPSVIRIGNEWWAFSTMSHCNGKRVHVPMAHTYDFNTWTSFGEQDALPNLPSWVNPNAPAI